MLVPLFLTLLLPFTESVEIPDDEYTAMIKIFSDGFKDAAGGKLNGILACLAFLIVFNIALTVMTILYIVAQLWCGGALCSKSTSQSKEYNYPNIEE